MYYKQAIESRVNRTSAGSRVESILCRVVGTRLQSWSVDDWPSQRQLYSIGSGILDTAMRRASRLRLIRKRGEGNGIERSERVEIYKKGHSK